MKHSSLNQQQTTINPGTGASCYRHRNAGFIRQQPASGPYLPHECSVPIRGALQFGGGIKMHSRSTEAPTYLPSPIFPPKAPQLSQVNPIQAYSSQKNIFPCLTKSKSRLLRDLCAFGARSSQSQSSLTSRPQSLTHYDILTLPPCSIQ